MKKANLKRTGRKAVYFVLPAFLLSCLFMVSSSAIAQSTVSVQGSITSDGAMTPDPLKENEDESEEKPTEISLAFMFGPTMVQIQQQGNVNFRSDATSKSEKVGTGLAGEKYLLVEEKDGWYSILMEDGNIGWVSSKLCTLVQN